MPDFFFDDPATEATVWNEIRARTEENANLRRQVTPDQAQNLALTAQTYPNLTNDVLTGLSLAGVNYDHPALVELAQRQEKKRSGFFNAISNKINDVIVDPFEATVRGTFTAFGTVWEEVASRPFRTLVGTLQGRSVMDAYRDAGESAGVKALRSLSRGEPVNLGSGFIPQSTETVTRPEFAQRVVQGTPVPQAIEQTEAEFGAPITRIADEQQRQIQFRGAPVSFGRVTAGLLFEPGKLEYNILSGLVDGAAQIAADPTFAAGKAVTATRNSRRIFGLVDDATRPSMLRPLTVNNFLGGRDGARLANWLADQEGAEGLLRIKNVLQKPGRPNLPRRLILDLANESDPERIMNTLSQHLGVTPGLRTTPYAGVVSRKASGLIGGAGEAGKIGGFRAAARVVGSERKPRLLKTFSEMPGHHLDLDNLDDAFSGLDDFLVSMEFNAAQRGKHLRRFAALEEGDKAGAYRVMRGVSKDVKNSLLSHGIQDDVAEEAAQLFHKGFVELEQGRSYWGNSIAHMPFPGMKVKNLAGGKVEVMPSPIQISEYLNRNIPLPNPRQMRRALSPISRAAKKGHLEGGTMQTAIDAAMSRYWKPAVLLRGAWPVRVVGEEQFRVAASGLDSFVNHPIRAVQMAINKPMFGLDPTFNNGVKGTFDNMLGFEAAQSTRIGGLLGRGVDSNFDLAWQPIAKGQATYNSWWRKYLQRLRADPTLRSALDDLDAAEDSFVANKALRTKLGNTPEKAVLKTSDEAARQYVRAVHARAHEATGGRIRLVNRKTGEQIWETGENLQPLSKSAAKHFEYEVIEEGSPGLLQALREGDLFGVKLADPAHDKRLTKALAGFDGPSVVPGQAMPKGRQMAGQWDQGVDRAFAWLGSKPTNFLSRSPAFKQLYWQRVGELVPFMDDATKGLMREAAEQANLPRKLLDEMAEAAGKQVDNTGRVIDNLDEVDMIAQAHGLAETKRLLYDLNRRHQWTDITRNIFPFGEAWSEIITTWARLVKDQPIEISRRFQQIIEGARGSDEVFGGQGFFYENANGDEVFAYPGSGLIADWMFGPDAGTGLRLEGNVSSLNLFTQSFLPGFGPVVQIPVADLLSETPTAGSLLEQLNIPIPAEVLDPDTIDAIQGTVSPFQQSTDPITSPGGLLDRALIPSWFRRMLIGVNQDSGPWDRLYGNTVIDLYKGKLLKGDLADVTPEAQAQALERAKKDATSLSLLRGVLQFFAPSAPQLSLDVEDKSGNIWGLQVLSDELRRQLDANDWDTATVYASFQEQFGVDPFLLMEPKSEQIQRRSSTKEGLDFQRRNRGLFEEFPHTAYYAQPDDAMDEFDYTAYIESLRTGARVPKTPEQWQAAANHALGSFEYETAKRELTDPTSEQSKAYLKAKKAWLVEQYPGYDPGSQLREFGSVSQPSRKAVIRELEKWRGNEFLSGTNAGQGLTKYFQARDQAMRRAVELGLQPESFATAKRAEPIRDYLRATAAWIVRQPEMAEFGSMWTFVLQHELKDDGDE